MIAPNRVVLEAKNVFVFISISKFVIIKPLSFWMDYSNVPPNKVILEVSASKNIYISCLPAKKI